MNKYTNHNNNYPGKKKSNGTKGKLTTFSEIMFRAGNDARTMAVNLGKPGSLKTYLGYGRWKTIILTIK